MTLSSLLGSEDAVNRPMVDVQMTGSKDKVKFLYDSGAQVSLMSKKVFRSISIKHRPSKIKFDLGCSGVSGNKLNIMGCYLFKLNILDKQITHPFFVADIPGQKGVIGIDIIKKHRLGLDAFTNEPIFQSPTVATLTKEAYLPPRSRQMVNVKIPSCNIKKNNSNLQILQIQVDRCAQVFSDEVLLQADTSGIAKIWLTNVSTQALRIPKGVEIGEVEAVEESELHPWLVSDTTPLVPPKKLNKIPIPVLDSTRKARIAKSANLSHLPENIKDKYLEILLNNHQCISLDEFDIGRCNKGAHSIPLKPNCPPAYSKQFPLPIEHEKEIRRQVLEWLKIGIIRPCESEFNSSLFLVSKKPLPPQPGEIGPRPRAYRIVQDLRALNKSTLASNVRLPEIQECLDRVAKKKPEVFSALDLRSGYFQLPIETASQDKTAFTSLSLGQQFCFTVASQGLTSAPASFARTMQRIFTKQIARNDLEVYLDDVLAYSKTHGEMLKTLDEALKNLISSGMKLNLEKCQFGIDKLTYLGFELNKDGIKPDPAKAEGITKVVEPSTLKGVRSFLGMCNFYRLLIPKFNALVKPLINLTCKGAWTGGALPPDAQAAFKKCQTIFATQPFLQYPDFNLDFHLFVDASLGQVEDPKGGGLAGCLVQYPNNDPTKPVRPIGYCSRSLLSHERNYSTHLVESAGVIFSIEFWEKYLRGRKFFVHTDHKPLTTIKEGKVHKRTLERFKEILAHYDFTLLYTPGDLIPSDFMSRHVQVDSVKLHSEVTSLLHDCEKKKVSNLTKVAMPIQKEIFQSQTEKLVHTTQCVNSPTVCSVHQMIRPAHTDCHGRSLLVQADVHSIDTTQHAENLAAPKVCMPLKELKVGAAEAAQSSGLASPLVKDSVAQVANSTLSTHTSSVGSANDCNHSEPTVPSQPVQPAKVTLAAALLDLSQRVDNMKKVFGNANPLRTLKSYSIYGVSKLQSFDLLDTKNDKDPKLMKMQQSDDPFIQAIVHFIKTKALPSERFRSMVKRWGPSCFLHKDIVMVKYVQPGYPTRDLVLAPAHRIGDIIAEAHGSLLGGHDGSHKTSQRILTNYWFPGVHSEVHYFVENCSICQKHKKKAKASNTYLRPLKQADAPFERVHLDLFGPLKTRDGKKYICSITDSFSKYTVFKVIPDKSAITVANCFFESWISVFGSPMSIVTDRGTDFHTDTMQSICNYLQIDKKVISTQHPESNSQAEILNKKLAKYLKAMRDKSPLDWEDLVPSCQYAYNLSIHKALKNSPYSVLFGVDANTPLNSKGFVTKPIYGSEWQDTMASRLKAARSLAKDNNMAFRNDYVKHFNSKVDPHTFREGQLVFLHRPELNKINKKIQSSWFGPNVILSIVGHNNCLIQDLANRRTRFVNSNRLRPYNLKIKDWEKFRLALPKNAADNANNEIMQSEQGIEKNSAAPAHNAQKYIEFDSTNDVTVLNPWVQPIPKIIKVEPEILDSSVEDTQSQDHNVSEEIAQDEPSTPPSPASTSYGKVLLNLFPGTSPKKTSKKSSKKPEPSTSRMFTRQKAMDTDIEVPTARQTIDKAEKEKKSKKSKLKKAK